MFITSNFDRKNYLKALKRFRDGDFSVRLPDDLTGVPGEIAEAFNDVVSYNDTLSKELTRLRNIVGQKGNVEERASNARFSGSWADNIRMVNALIDDLVLPVSEMSDIISSVSEGNLSRRMTLQYNGEKKKGVFLDSAQKINAMVERLSSFASEVTRVAREVGTEGKLGGQAKVKDLSGTWNDLTGSVNTMAYNLTNQVRNIAEVTTAVATGDLSKKITVDASGEILELRNTINTMVDQLSSFASEVTRVAREVGTEGKLGGQASVEGVSGTWKDLTDNVNMMANNLTEQVRNIAEVTTAVANGDFSKKIAVNVRGEILELKNTINTMVDQLSSFASEVTRVARDVGTEGKLGGQGEVPGVAGTWKDLTDNVNTMAENLTNQVRGIARVVTAVANGDLKRKLSLEAKGEIADLAETINEMTDTLATFADQVTNVAREVGIEGKLGAQARVPGAAGLWRDLTDNVNELAANLTTQVRAIAEVATAVTEGDLTRTITADARGEVVELKNNINEMIRNLRETTSINKEQDWLNTNLARFAGMFQGQRNLLNVGNLILSELAPLVNAQNGAFYMVERENGEVFLKLLAGYAYQNRNGFSNRFGLGEGLAGQCAVEKERIVLSEVPDDYIKISSGLGEAVPRNIIVLPVLFEDEIQAVIELAAFNQFSDISISFLDQLTENIGVMLNTIAATMRTEELLEESQSLAKELKNQQEEMRHTNKELEEKAKQLVRQKEEVEHARISVEEKAGELALASKYKSEFLANMSHELRTPLNSLLLLAELMGSNREGNLTEEQLESAQVILESGNQLLSLINEILDLARIESGKMDLEYEKVSIDDLVKDIQSHFTQMARAKGLAFDVVVSKSAPQEIEIDKKRTEQVIRNLISNAVKFTKEGHVSVHFSKPENGTALTRSRLDPSGTLAVSVKDTGIGIAENKRKIIFEAFQQGDGTTARKFGGTGLGLSISRELIRLLGGEIHMDSAEGKGSMFAIYLPVKAGPAQRIAPHGEIPLSPVPRPSPLKDSVPEASSSTGPSIPGSLFRDKKILIVEDDARNLFAISRRMEDEGMNIITAGDGKNALKKLEKHPDVDLIFMDIMMPGMDGYETIRRIRAKDPFRDLPIIALTAKAMAEDRKRCIEVGADDYMAKPVDFKRLLSMLQVLLNKESRVLHMGSEDAQDINSR